MRACVRACVRACACVGEVSGVCEHLSGHDPPGWMRQRQWLLTVLIAVKLISCRLKLLVELQMVYEST